MSQIHWDGIISLLLFFSVGISTIGYWTNNAQKIRLGQLCGSPFTLVYDILVNTWGGALCDANALASTLNTTVNDKNHMGISFSGAVDATAEKNEYISAIILSKDNKVKYYGKITESASGNQSCVLKLDDMVGSRDTLYVPNEQCNKDASIENREIKVPAETDYSSELKCTQRLSCPSLPSRRIRN